MRRFQKIDVNEPSVPDAIEILKGLKPYFEDFHRVRYTRRGDQVGGRAVGQVHPRPQAAGQGDRRDRRDRRLADAAARAPAAEDHRRQGGRVDHRHHGAHSAEDGIEVRRRGAARHRPGSEAGGVRPGPRHRGACRRDQAVARGPARAREADRLLPVLRPDRRRQDRGRRASSRRCSASSCSAST